MTEREAYIALNMAQGIGAVTVANGVAALGSAAAFFNAGAADLARVRGLSRESAEGFARAFAVIDWREEIRRADSMRTAIVSFADSAYPSLLKAIHGAPLALYVAGRVEALSMPCAAVVGTRAPTPYGRGNASGFASAFARAGFAVVSGLARGIDTEAHKAAMSAGGVTVAVVGSALDKLYPAENRELAREIVESGGAVVSEYPFGRAADKQTFPMRNRIISGLSSGVLVVEAGARSGTMITASHALEQGRNVMAIPGRIDNDNALGCHKLIKDGARLVDTPEEALDELLSFFPNSRLAACPAKAAPYAALSEPSAHDADAAAPRPSAPLSLPRPAPSAKLDEIESKIVEELKNGETTADALASATALPPHKISSRLTSLEMRLVIERVGPDIIRLRKGRLM